MNWRGMEIDGAIFDMDGTLIDSMGVWRNLPELYARGKGLTPDPRVDDTIWDQGMLNGAGYLKRIYGIDEAPETMVQEMFDLVVRFYQEQVREREGIRQILEELTAGGVRMCIASATDEWMGKHAMERTGLDRYFDRYFCCREVGEGKETDRIYQTARAYLGTDVERTVIFEDALYAARTVSTAGFKLVGIRDAWEPGQKELSSLADLYLDWEN